MRTNNPRLQTGELGQGSKRISNWARQYSRSDVNSGRHKKIQFGAQSPVADCSITQSTGFSWDIYDDINRQNLTIISCVMLVVFLVWNTPEYMFGSPVKRPHRVRFNPIWLNNLPSGEFCSQYGKAGGLAKGRLVQRDLSSVSGPSL